MPLYFGMFVSVAAYLVGMALKKKLGWAILNPLLVAILLVMALLKATGISYGDYNQGASYISYFLTPATVCLAIPLYKQLELLKKNLAAVLCGITTGVAGSVLSIFAMSVWSMCIMYPCFPNPSPQPSVWAWRRRPEAS